jgi:hypothetical protein
MGDCVFSCSKGAPKRAQDGSEKIVELRKRGFTLQEIADAVDNSRLDVFRHLLRVLDRNDRLQLGLPT